MATRKKKTTKKKTAASKRPALADYKKAAEARGIDVSGVKTLDDMQRLCRVFGTALSILIPPK